MENKKFQFKTNLNCGGCVSKVQSDLDNAEGICHWDVDTDHENKILTINSTGITIEELESIIQRKGFKIESI